MAGAAGDRHHDASRSSTTPRRTSSTPRLQLGDAGRRSWPCWCWIVASVGFAFYVANFASYNKTYGSARRRSIVFLVWLWITNLAILFGAELNAELERSRQIAADPSAAEREPFMPARAEPKS